MREIRSRNSQSSGGKETAVQLRILVALSSNAWKFRKIISSHSVTITALCFLTNLLSLITPSVDVIKSQTAARKRLQMRKLPLPSTSLPVHTWKLQSLQLLTTLHKSIHKIHAAYGKEETKFSLCLTTTAAWRCMKEWAHSAMYS